MIRVLLADDQPLLRHGFAMILSAQPDIEVIGEAADGAEAVRLTGLLRPDVVLMDVRMPGMDGIEATRKITVVSPPTRVIILTTFDVDEYAFDGLRAGASGFLLKNARPEELLSGIRSVATGDAVLAPSTTRRVLDAFADGFVSQPPTETPGADVLGVLTARELEVFTEMAAGSTNKEIAQRLHLSETTVKTHVVRVLAKLGLRDRTQAVIFAYERGIKRPQS
ncbi:MAG TPA: response regulator transcription factor [Streptosporangiaceae bacterium]|nr:response regulator transcription factor [Streptosporangiaceae bacterium]